MATLKKTIKLVFKTNYRLMQVKVLQNAPRGAFCNTLTFIKLPYVIKIFILSIFEWPFYTGFTVGVVWGLTYHPTLTACSKRFIFLIEITLIRAQ